MSWRKRARVNSLKRKERRKDPHLVISLRTIIVGTFRILFLGMGISITKHTNHRTRSIFIVTGGIFSMIKMTLQMEMGVESLIQHFLKARSNHLTLLNQVISILVKSWGKVTLQLVIAELRTECLLNKTLSFPTLTNETVIISLH